MSTTGTTSKRKIRTPAERAAAYQAAANRARAQAVKQARNEDVTVRLLIADTLIDAVLNRGLGVEDASNMEFLRLLIGNHLPPDQWAKIEIWWKAKGWPVR